MTLQAPWSDKAIKANWPEIEAVAKKHKLPMPTPVGRKFDELGCGHYGCVMSTSNDEVVFKLTSDPTEAAFIQEAGPLGWPDGIVKYYDITGLEATYRNRKIFAIWREAAFEVGQMPPRTPELMCLDRFRDYSSGIHYILKNAKNPEAVVAKAKKLEDWAWKTVVPDNAYWLKCSVFGTDGLSGAPKVAAYWRACEIVSEMMANTEIVDSIGRALEFYLKRGFLLADVHRGNIGRVRRDRYDPWVITDPGHVVRVAL